MSLTIYYTRAFEGPRHDRVYQLWDRIEKALPKDVEIIVGPDVGGHEASFSDAYDTLAPLADHLLLTEADFIMTPEQLQYLLTVNSFLDEAGVDAYGVEYATRSVDGALQRHGYPGGWWVLLNTSKTPEGLDFGGPDPGNELDEQINIELFPGKDVWPGIEYKFGTHLFWSRHWNDPPGARPAGFPLDDIRAKQDEILTEVEDAWQRFLET